MNVTTPIADRTPGKPSLERHVRIAIVGAGMAGILMGIKLRKAGIEDFIIFEKSDGVGGTWHLHSYPGLCCDIPSHLYSYSFELNSEWSKVYPEQPELQAYFDACARKYGVTSHIKFRTAVTKAQFDADKAEWRIEAEDGRCFTAQFLVTAQGGLNAPQFPDISGRESFAGVSFHSAQWNGTADLSGKRVAVIGSAASAIQIIPQAAAKAAHVDVFQRTPNWILPRHNEDYTQKQRERFRRFPFLMRLHRLKLYLTTHMTLFAFRGNRFVSNKIMEIAKANMRKSISDPAMLRALTPNYLPGCKRLLISDDYYPALARPNVELVTDRIGEIEREGIRTVDGRLHKADVVIYCTGYQVPNTEGFSYIRNAEGMSIADAWRDRLEAHRGVALPGFPNYFMMTGPNGILGYTSVILPAEIEADYIIRTMEKAAERRLETIEVRRDAMDAYNNRIQAGLRDTIWATDCPSYYKDEHGRVIVFYPWSASRFSREMRHASLEEYAVS